MTGWAVLGALAVAAAAGARWWLVTHPLGKCPWCRGSGRNPLSTKKRFGTCRHCDGSGRRKRRKQ